MKRTKAMNIQLGITQRLNRLRKKQVLAQEDCDYLRRRTRELYELAKEAGKLDEIKEIVGKAVVERK